MEKKENRNIKDKKSGLSRRSFLKLTKDMMIGIGAGGVLTHIVWVKQGMAAIPVSEGYLLVDIKKCQGCASCMLACSLIHEGVESLSLSRIQVMQNSFESFPDDLTIEQCRQCVDPPCVKECPADALAASAKHGYVRMVDKEKCIGCGTCYDICPYTPSRAVLAADKDYDGELKSRKCDLCANAPFHWDEAGGGPVGKQACVEVCPVGAIMFTKEIPLQEGEDGYKVNLRGKIWKILGYPSEKKDPSPGVSI
jgi:protein NrfC